MWKNLSAIIVTKSYLRPHINRGSSHVQGNVWSLFFRRAFRWIILFLLSIIDGFVMDYELCRVPFTWFWAGYSRLGFPEDDPKNRLYRFFASSIEGRECNRAAADDGKIQLHSAKRRLVRFFLSRDTKIRCVPKYWSGCAAIKDIGVVEVDWNEDKTNDADDARSTQ